MCGIRIVCHTDYVVSNWTSAGVHTKISCLLLWFCIAVKVMGNELTSLRYNAHSQREQNLQASRRVFLTASSMWRKSQSQPNEISKPLQLVLGLIHLHVQLSLIIIRVRLLLVLFHVPIVILARWYLCHHRLPGELLSVLHSVSSIVLTIAR